MIRFILLIAALLFSSAAFAQTCAQTFTTTVTYKGEAVGSGSVHYDGLDNKAMAGEIAKHGMKVVDAASRAQNKGGNYSLKLAVEVVCGAAAPERQELQFDGLTMGGLRSVFAAQQVSSNELLTIVASLDRRGKKRVWGKD